MTKPTKKQEAKAIQFARDHYAVGSNDDIEIDDKPNLSPADGGIWVSAWVWVTDGEVRGK